jgi:Flp pilus assembly pilin Flp
MMNRFSNIIARLHKDESGQGLVEYVLVVAFLVLVATASMETIAGDIKTIFTNLATEMSKAAAGTAGS